MPEFPHLHLRSEVSGLFKSRGGGPRPNALTIQNIANRQTHGTALLSSISQLSTNWTQNLTDRKEAGLPELPDENIVPVFLRVDPDAFDIESLKGFGVEIISEEDEGFIIGAAAHDFLSLREKIQKFLNEQGVSKDQAAKLWQINEGLQWRVDYILSDGLRAIWSAIGDDVTYVVDVGIACYVKIPNQPEINDGETNEHYEGRLRVWSEKKQELEISRDSIAVERESNFERFVRAYNGIMLSDYEDFDDSLTCRIRISGRGLKDIVSNYQYLFEVIEYDPYTLTEAEQGEPIEINPELLPPPTDAPRVCVIDSGIQEGHRLLAPAIDPVSVSFIPNDTSTADSVLNGGHGTRVAGAVIYSNNIPRTGQYQLSFFIQNARILQGTQGVLPESLFPPSLMERIVDSFQGTKIFNLSVNSRQACKLVHMSQWAAAIDRIMFERGVLFIASAGNISKLSGNPTNPGIKEHLRNNRPFPEYLLENASRIANPAQSCFALTVGSVCIDGLDTELKESFGVRDDPSSFSRTGLGLWGMIKPDVVEYAGDFAKEKNEDPNLTIEGTIAPELVRSTLHDGSAVGRDVVGTSFAAPKVSHIAAHLQLLFPNENVNLYRALIVHSARLPQRLFERPTIDAIKKYGYGIPSLQRAIDNSRMRVSLFNSGEISAKKANVYFVKVPNDLRRPGDEHDILIEVTLSYMARPRRTRRRTQSYLSTWLDWRSSKLTESHERFCSRVVQDMENQTEHMEDQGEIPWQIRERKDRSLITDLRRQDSTIQKSWCVMKSFALPQELSIAVIGHRGWNKDLSERVPYSIVVSFEALGANINVYEMIRVENEIQIEVPVTTL